MVPKWKVLIIIAAIILTLKIIFSIILPAKIEVIDISTLVSTESPADFASPCWLPSGEEVIYIFNEAHKHFSSAIQKTSLKSGNTTQLFSQKGYLTTLAISPDGKRIAFSPGGIWIINSEGGSLIQLNNDGDTPSWSPDGRKIAYTVYRYKEVNGRKELIGNNVWIMNSDGTSQRQLISMYSHSPCWSPDGTKIAFIGKKNGKSAIFVADADGTNIKLLTKEFVGGIKYRPSWSPDGEWITYTYCMAFGANREIKVVKTDGRGKQTLTPSNIDAYSPSWSPDGNKIAFVKAEYKGAEGRGEYSICVMTLKE